MNRNSQLWQCLIAVLAAVWLPIAATGQETPANTAPGSASGDDPFADPTNSARPHPALVPGAGGVTGASAAADKSASDFCRCIGDGDVPGVERIRDTLQSPLKATGLDFADTPLEEIVALLQEEYGIPIKLDTPALSEMGLSPDEPVTISLRSISLHAALRLMLKQIGLTYLIQDEVLLITTPDEAERQLRTCVYDVRDLVDAAKAHGTDEIIDAIVSCVATETWAENGGGEAEIRSLKPGLLVVSQMQSVHEQIRELLATIRAIRSQPSGNASHDAAAAHLSGAGAVSDEVVTRSYFLQINPPPDNKQFSGQVRELITTALPEAEWDVRLPTGQGVLLTVLPDRIVLRHRESVHNKVEALLTDTGIASALRGDRGEAGTAFGGGGGGSSGRQGRSRQSDGESSGGFFRSTK
jgi:hypothetical protein